VGTDQPLIRIGLAALIFVAAIITASCSEKSAANREKDSNVPETRREIVSEVETAEHADEFQPDKDQIEEDCATFVRSTKVLPARAAATVCPGCPAGGTAVLAFRGVKQDSVSCSDATCNVLVTIRAVYNTGSGERITGGLTAWLPPEERNEYLSGHTPSGEQTYHVQITYKRRGAAWRAVEFDRAPAK
jgi:hypothetical protein